MIEHKVAKGESLSVIAERYAVSVDTIMWSNSLSNPNRLKIGQTLKFPSISGVVHLVTRGESIWTIAKKYGVSRDEIVRTNQLDEPDKLKLKQALVIPGAKPLPVRNSPVAVASRGAASSRSSGSSSGDALIWPLSGRISSRFGFRWGRMHNGLDIAVPIGTPVKAAADGCVIFAGWRSGYGRLVILDHGAGVHTYYGHNSSFTVSAGDAVAAGDRIALSGNSGVSTGPHLHFEVRVNGRARNPLDYLR
jgi:murein DD-endopeptidase MepM/ murein hydrolase activator NlpD